MLAARLSKRLFTSSKRKQALILASDSIENICAKVFSDRGHTLVHKPGIAHKDLVAIIGDYDGLVVRSGTQVNADIIESASKLKIIGRAGTGVDNIDVVAATKKGILVANTPGGNTISTGELAVSHLLALARNIPQATASLKAGKWERTKYMGTELTGKTLGIIGVGKIGREVGKRCKSFGMNIIGYDPLLSEHSARSYGIEPVTLDKLFEQSDFITIHTPLTKETYHLFNKDTLAMCKKGMRIINCARGGIIDEQALLEAIQSGHVAGAALDVLEQEPPTDASLELRKHPNIVMTPHLGASTYDAQERVARQIAMNICDILDGGSYVGVVNAPDLGTIAKQEHIVPYIKLAEKIGSMQGQLLKGNKVSSMIIHLRGKDLVSDNKISTIIKSAVIKGLLTELGMEQITLINAITIAEDIGLRILMNLSEKTEQDSGYMNSLSIELEIEGMLNTVRVINGTVFGRNEIRITNIDGYNVDLPLFNNNSSGNTKNSSSNNVIANNNNANNNSASSATASTLPSINATHMLLWNNYDKPGVLRKVLEKLAEAHINISHFSLGRKQRGKLAMGAVVLDSIVPDHIIQSLKKGAEMSNVIQLSFKDIEDPNFRVKSSALSSTQSHQQGHVYGLTKPLIKPKNPEFSSGPCKKYPGYQLSQLRTDILGRSHRSKLGKNRLKKSIEETKRILQIPDDYLCGILPASDTGAFELALWNLLSNDIPVDICYWESFGKGWYDDITKHLKLPKQIIREFKANYGLLPNLSDTNSHDHDIVFTYNGTTSGVRVPNLDWISSSRKGLTFNDATSAAFAMNIDWSKVDVTTFSWQKVLGGEGAHGMLILSPRAIERLQTIQHSRPLPKIFRITKTTSDGKKIIDKSIFQGDTINTPSMLCNEDYLNALSWADSIGGLKGLITRSESNLATLEQFVNKNKEWIQFLAQDPSIRSNTSVCFTLKLSKEQVKQYITLLENEDVAYDIGSYRDAPDGLRIWCGATVEKEDLEALCPWLEWAYQAVQDKNVTK